MMRLLEIELHHVYGGCSDVFHHFFRNVWSLFVQIVNHLVQFLNVLVDYLKRKLFIIN